MTADEKKTCAYCGGNGPFTREHIIPKFLYRRYPDQNLGYNQKAGRYLEYEGIVRDVCRMCNSGPLSDLDAYGKIFTESNRCHRTFTSRPRILIRYDYQSLLRWLLKISFNAMRAMSRDTSSISACIPFIMRSDPMPFHVEALIEVIQNMTLTARERLLLPEPLRHLESVSSHRFRIGEFGLVEKLPTLCRFVAINAFYFYLILFDLATPPEEVDSFLQAFRRDVPQAFHMHPSLKALQVRVSKRTIFETYQDQALRELPAWIQYEAAKRAK